MRWRLLIWAAAVIAVGAAVGLAVDVAVAGTGNAAALAGVIVGFCELAALVLGVTAWASERRASAASRKPEGEQSAVIAGDSLKPPVPNRRAEDTRYTVDARGANGLQVGEGNTQHIDFHRSSPSS